LPGFPEVVRPPAIIDLPVTFRFELVIVKQRPVVFSEEAVPRSNRAGEKSCATLSPRTVSFVIAVFQGPLYNRERPWFFDFQE
jgi:hypothetical protein